MYSPSFSTARVASGVTSTSKSNGSKTRLSSTLYTSRPSVEAHANALAVGENCTLVTRISGRVERAAKSPRFEPGSMLSARLLSSRSDNSPSSSISSMAPASVMFFELRNCIVPFSCMLFDTVNRLRSTSFGRSYKQIELLFPAATKDSPSKLYAIVEKYLPLAELPATKRSSTCLPVMMWLLPSIWRTCLPFSTSQKVICPSSVAAATSFESGRIVRARHSCSTSNGSLVCVREKMSQILIVLSHDALASLGEPSVPKLRHEMGPSWPASWSRSCAVCTDHTWMLKSSKEPAHTMSPLGSTAKQLNCNRFVDVNTRKFLYRIRSHARTVPSSDDENITWPFLAKTTCVTAEMCSSNVARQNPETTSQILIFPSSDAVTIRPPSGEYARQFIASKWPCCFKMYDSDCHS
ncbi:hypothetical protein OGAPHI_003645 [Ogataea philodendri]|uniref:Uncharacterized protein n=1 Tax=Ogataea philodendri TaxID=1378263 RepID=A0A9P8T475_9ASCO|nr:uncharacterized protein OGAPHI_003645 [Ogataea philodendri]KAH3665461.1 hypothetical protein OGAPHI_003645 [Ogataea philodendri]